MSHPPIPEGSILSFTLLFSKNDSVHRGEEAPAFSPPVHIPRYIYILHALGSPQPIGRRRLPWGKLRIRATPILLFDSLLPVVSPLFHFASLRLCVRILSSFSSFLSPAVPCLAEVPLGGTKAGAPPMGFPSVQLSVVLCASRWPLFSEAALFAFFFSRRTVVETDVFFRGLS